MDSPHWQVKAHLGHILSLDAKLQHSGAKSLLGTLEIKRKHKLLAGYHARALDRELYPHVLK
jgi:hypothetical protein